MNKEEQQDEEQEERERERERERETVPIFQMFSVGVVVETLLPHRVTYIAHDYFPLGCTNCINFCEALFIN
jgi:hypothetical protein